MARRKKSKTRSRASGAVRLAGGRVADTVYEGDPDNRPVSHARTVDTLGMMLRRGTISDEMYDAAQEFRTTFSLANFPDVRALPPDRIIGATTGYTLSDSQVGARRRVTAALDAVGGLSSPGGGCLWYIVGLEHSIRDWAQRQGWGGRPISHAVAQGILLACLGTLSTHYGIANTRSRSNVYQQST